MFLLVPTPAYYTLGAVVPDQLLNHIHVFMSPVTHSLEEILVDLSEPATTGDSPESLYPLSVLASSTGTRAQS